MSLNKFENDVMQLRSTSGRISSTVDDLSAETRILFDNISRLSAVWSGSAKEKLLNGFSEECVQLENAIKELNELSANLERICREDEKNEQTLLELASSLQV